MLAVRQVLPPALTAGLDDTRYWFVIGGQAVRCFVPYRPSRDADFGVLTAKDLRSLVAQLKQRGSVELLETSADTVHLNFEGVDVSLFVLPILAEHVSEQVLTPTGILATKLHAILDRGARRDFFDLYVMLQAHSFGIMTCLQALSQVYKTEVNQSLVLRSLGYFEDAEGEGPLPGEGEGDWQSVRSYFAKAVAALVVPPTHALQIQTNVVDVRPLQEKSGRSVGKEPTARTARPGKPKIASTQKRSARKKRG